MFRFCQTAFRHPSLRRIILSKTKKPNLSPSHMRPPVKLIILSVKLVYVSNGFHGNYHGHLHYKVGSSGVGRLEPQCNVRSLNLDFNNWHVFMIEKVLPSLPLLIELKVKGCAQTVSWFFAII